MRMTRSLVARTRALLVSAVTIAAVAGAADHAFAQASAPLVGTWGIVSTPRNCETTAPLGPPIRALVTFHNDGTLVESIVLLLFAPGQRTLGHGAWRQSTGTTYADQSVVLVGFDTPPNTPPGSPGFPAGWIVSASTITLINADRFESSGRTRFYDVNRQEYRPPTCATRVGERFR